MYRLSVKDAKSKSIHFLFSSHIIELFYEYIYFIYFINTKKKSFLTIIIINSNVVDINKIRTKTFEAISFNRHFVFDCLCSYEALQFSFER